MSEGFGTAAPVFRVSSLAASVDYYVKLLGFRVDWQEPGIIASVSRDRCTIFLCEGDQGHFGTWVWIGVGDAGAVFEEFRRKGAIIRLPPTNYPWAYELQVSDPDGNVIRLGSEPKPDQPFGAWLDMRGDRWELKPGGGWERIGRGPDTLQPPSA